MTALLVVQRERPADKVQGHQGGARLQGLGRRRAAARQADQLETMLNGLLLPSGNDAAIALAQRVERHGPGLRHADERAGARRSACRARTSRRRAASSTRATTRARPTSPRSPARSSTSRASRGSSSAAGRSCRSRSRAGGSTSSTTTRCCARATRARSGSRPASRTPPAAASWRPRSAAAGASASCCCTRRTPAARPRSSWTAASRSGADGAPGRGRPDPGRPRPVDTRSALSAGTAASSAWRAGPARRGRPASTLVVVRARRGPRASCPAHEQAHDDRDDQVQRQRDDARVDRRLRVAKPKFDSAYCAPPKCALPRDRVRRVVEHVEARRACRRPSRRAGPTRAARAM